MPLRVLGEYDTFSWRSLNIFQCQLKDGTLNTQIPSTRIGKIQNPSTSLPSSMSLKGQKKSSHATVLSSAQGLLTTEINGGKFH